MRWALMVATAALLSGGCASVPLKTPSSAEPAEALWQTHRRAVADFVSWNLSGRIALRTADMAASASLRWIRSEDRDEIYLFGPLGGGKVQLTIEPDAVTLRDARGQVVKGVDPSEVLYQVTGWHIPFEALDDWIRGLPSSEPINAMAWDPDGRPTQLDQSGWEISYLDFMPVDALFLPRKIRIAASDQTVDALVGAGQLNGDRLALRFFVESWNQP